MKFFRYSVLTLAASALSQLTTVVIVLALTFVVVVAIATAYPKRDPIARWIRLWRGRPPGG